MQSSARFKITQRSLAVFSATKLNRHVSPQVYCKNDRAELRFTCCNNNKEICVCPVWTYVDCG